MKAFLRNLIPVFADTVYGYCIFLFCTFAAADVTLDYNYFAVLACTVFASVVNYRLFLREPTLMTVALVNAALVVMTEIVGFATENEIEGVVLHAIAGIVFLVPLVHGLLLYRRPVRANAMLLFCECSIAGTAVFMGFDLGYFDAPPRAIVLSVICLALNLILLSALRSDAPSARKTEVKKQIERGVILAVVVACAVFAAVAIVVFALPAVRGAIFGAVSGIGRFFVFLGKSLSAFFAWLAEVLPDLPAMDAGALPAGETPPAPGANELEGIPDVPDSAWILIFSILAAVVIAAIVIAVIRLRRKRFRLRTRTVPITREEMEREEDLWMRLFGFWRFLLLRISFARRLFARRYSQEGFFVRLSLIAKRKGHARAQTETAAAYLNRLSRSLTKADSFAVLDVPVGFFAELAAQIDRRLYAPGASKIVPVNRDLARRILRAARKLGATEE